jgi:hypothetical protein
MVRVWKTSFRKTFGLKTDEEKKVGYYGKGKSSANYRGHKVWIWECPVSIEKWSLRPIETLYLLSYHGCH